MQWGTQTLCCVADWIRRGMVSDGRRAEVGGVAY